MDAQHYKDHAQDLQGDIIKQLFVFAEQIADLHAVLTGPRGEFFRKKLLQYLSDGLTHDELEKLRKEFGLAETARHINQLLKYKLIKEAVVEKTEGYIRTSYGERTTNALRALEESIGDEKAQKIFFTALGKNSIRMFLKVYGLPKEPQDGDIIYTPLEIGQISAFLPRTIEGVAAVDKLDDAGLVSYLDDGRIHVNPRRSVAFYQYLKELYALIFELS